MCASPCKPRRQSLKETPSLLVATARKNTVFSVQNPSTRHAHIPPCTQQIRLIGNSIKPQMQAVLHLRLETASGAEVRERPPPRLVGIGFAPCIKRRGIPVGAPVIEHFRNMTDACGLRGASARRPKAVHHPQHQIVILCAVIVRPEFQPLHQPRFHCHKVTNIVV